MKSLLSFFTTAILLYGNSQVTAAAVPTDQMLFGGEGDSRVVVNNRILATVHGKPISAVDVMKKMDMLFYQQFPEYASSPKARYQFYQINWKRVLNDLIDKELMLVDAEELKMTVSNGDVRQEIEQMLGPNVIENLDTMDMTVEEATKIVQGDILIRRISMFRVNNKALKRITPLEVRKAYETFISKKENVRPSTWTYQVISLRNPQAVQGASTAQLVYESLNAAENSEAPLADRIKSLDLSDKTTTLNVSEEYHHTEDELSPAYKEILITQEPGAFSKPTEQKSRADNSIVYRIFYLKEKQSGGVPPLAEVENQIKDKIMQQAMKEENESYLKKLRQRYGLNEKLLKEMVPDNFQPFILK